jgi:hypothetical protein
MPRLYLGLISGIAFGLLSAASMIPLSFADKRAALLGAFCSRFAIGFLVCVVNLPMPSWASGLLVGLLISLPDAIITKAYAPILIIGTIGGAIIGLITGKFAR